MKICMYGAGQQGTSQGLAFARLSEVKQVTFYDINLQEDIIRQKATEFGIDQSKLVFAQTVAEAVKGSHIIGVNTPMDTFKDVAQKIAAHAENGAVIYDNGSGKENANADVKAGLGSSIQEKNLSHFPLHFFVGRAGTGPSFATPDMYNNGTAAIMESDNKKGQALIKLLKQIGVKNVRTDLTLERHDESLAIYSQHNTFAVTSLMLAFPQVTIAGNPINIGRFLSTTRVAAHGVNGATLWGPIAEGNRDKIVDASKLFFKQIAYFEAALKGSNKDSLSRLFFNAHEYTSDVPEDRPAEDIEGDIHDRNILLQNVTTPPPSRPLYSTAVSHIAMPIVFAGVSALMAREYEQEGGEPFVCINNSSFHDSIRPARGKPEKAADYIHGYRGDVWKATEALKITHQVVLRSIKDRQMGSLATYLRKSHDIRSQLPDARVGDDMRQEYIIK